MPDISTVPPDLSVPELSDDPPGAGKRVRLELFEGTPPVILYLPTDWVPAKTFPVIIELAGNGNFKNNFGDTSSGLPEGSKLGYGLSGGKGFIWACVPFLNEAGNKTAITWWGDPPDYRPDSTVAFLKRAVPALCERFSGDPQRVILTGFSRGAIAANAIGLHDDEIAELWRGFVCYSHYDGLSSRWPFAGKDTASVRQRLARLNGRPQLICCESTTASTRKHLESTGTTGDFTFLETGFRNHNDAWALRPSAARDTARAWLAELVKMPADSLIPFDATGEIKPIPLAGEWRFQLDAKQSGIEQKWHSQKLTDTIRLPGTTDEAHKGILNDERAIDRLSRVWFWKGAAWYQREVTIPDSWQGKRITLFLERTKHSSLWVNDTFISWEDSLSAPHVFDLTAALTPGTHTLTLLIDNSKLPPVGPSHAVDERTQTNWNGIVGRIELRASDPVWIEDVKVFPNAAKREARVVARIGNTTGNAIAGQVRVSSASRNVKTPETFTTKTFPFQANHGGSTVEFIYQSGDKVPLWDEFNPALIDLELQLTAASFTDTRTVTFGMRDFTRQGNRLLINGRPVFLRGRVDCANYPLTGCAPMDRDSWRRILQIQKDWGLNHIRFHSWCPPAAAFEVADELGFYLQVELPNKRSAFNAPDEANAAIHNYDFLDVNTSDAEVTLFDYGKREGELIFRHFGNSPAFTMFTLGNELGMSDGMAELVAHFKKSNPRALHAQGSNNMHWEPTLPEDDDFWVIAKIEKIAKPLRAAFHSHRNPPGHVENAPPSTLVDYRESIAGVPVPAISHETGAYQVSPDFNEIDKFTGVLRARNYEVFRDRLEKAGMLDQADDFVKASGALAAICYREEIEAALRTPGLGGFQLLDIMDFPGQGTAPVGMLDVFMDNKGILQPEQWREFCSETVPLLRIEKYTWTRAETLTAKIQVAHYGPQDILDAKVSAGLIGIPGGGVAFPLPKTTLPSGVVTDIGTITLDFNLIDLAVPRRVMFKLGIEGTPYQNTYPLWIYPSDINTTVPDGILVSRNFSDHEIQAHLTKGGRVLLLPEMEKLPHSVPGAFMTDYWSPMFAQGDRKRGETPPPGTLGVLFNPSSPPGGNALARFPTESHSNWQWWHLVKNARPIILDETPRAYRPIIQVIDNFDRNHKLGLIFETKVGAGSLLVCAIDLPALQDKPEARQLLHSLLEYIESPAFTPKDQINSDVLNKLLP